MPAKAWSDLVVGLEQSGELGAATSQQGSGRGVTSSGLNSPYCTWRIRIISALLSLRLR